MPIEASSRPAPPSSSREDRQNSRGELPQVQIIFEFAGGDQDVGIERCGLVRDRFLQCGGADPAAHHQLESEFASRADREVEEVTVDIREADGADIRRDTDDLERAAVVTHSQMVAYRVFARKKMAGSRFGEHHHLRSAMRFALLKAAAANHRYPEHMEVSRRHIGIRYLMAVGLTIGEDHRAVTRAAER